jgi:hypothetical protein
VVLARVLPRGFSIFVINRERRRLAGNPGVDQVNRPW